MSLVLNCSVGRWAIRPTKAVWFTLNGGRKVGALHAAFHITEHFEVDRNL